MPHLIAICTSYFELTSGVVFHNSLNSRWTCLGSCWLCIEYSQVQMWGMELQAFNPSCTQNGLRAFWILSDCFIYKQLCCSQYLFELYLCIGSYGHEAWCLIGRLCQQADYWPVIGQYCHTCWFRSYTSSIKLRWPQSRRSEIFAHVLCFIWYLILFLYFSWNQSISRWISAVGSSNSNNIGYIQKNDGSSDTGILNV